MRLSAIQFSDDRLRVEASYESRRGPFRLHYCSHDLPLSERLEAFLALGLFPAMAEGDRFVVPEGQVSKQFLAGLDRIQDLFCRWFPQLHRVQIEGPVPIVREPAPPGRTAVSFSGGVDSHYALLQHREEIDDLVFLHGFDEDIVDPRLCRQLGDRLRAFSDAEGKNLVKLETNARPFVQMDAPAHLGSAPLLIAAGQFLSDAVVRFFIPGSYSAAWVMPGTWHPEAIPLWSSEALAIVEAGGSVNRVVKTREIAKSDRVLECLHVCWGQHGTDYNCGICEKCLRTMINLEICGALARCPVFPQTIDRQRVANLYFASPAQRDMALANLEAIGERSDLADLAQALRRALNRPPWRLALARMYWSVKQHLGLTPCL